MGPARIIDIKDRESIKPEELRPHRIRRGERILFKTRNSTRVWRTKSFVEDFVYLSSDGARYLADRGIRTVGVDYLSIGGINNGPECHQSILKAGIWVIEGLDLSKVTPGRYQLICLPLKVVDGDGAPARAIVKLRN
jgi:arylformamidase